jgi:glutamate dehydrogenase
MAVREVFELPRLWARIDALDGRIGGQTQLGLYAVTRTLLDENARRLLAGGGLPAAAIAAAATRHKAAIAALADGLEGVLPPAHKEGLRQATQQLADSRVPADLARDVARLQVLAHAPAIADIAAETGADALDAARIFLEIGQRLHIDDLAARGAAIASADRYDRLAIAKALDRLAQARSSFTRDAIRAGGSEAWIARQGERLARAERTVAETAGPGALSLARLAVAAATLGDVAAGRP